MKFPWSASRSNSSASSDPEAGATPLEDMSFRSTETQRRNGFRQSTNPEHGERIVEDIRNGKYVTNPIHGSSSKLIKPSYTCSICLDPITKGSTSEYSIWHCLACYNVTHFRCAKSWAETSSRNAILSTSLTLGKWKCPSCAVECSEPRARCWCQKHSFGFLGHLLSDRPNACFDTCDRASTCPHGEEKPCLRLCHPGPCNVPCSPSCGGPAVHSTPEPWYRFRTRIRQLPPSSCGILISLFLLIILIYGLLGILLHFHLGWWTKPFKYPGFTDDVKSGEVLGLVMFGIFVILPGTVLILCAFYEMMAHVIVTALNLDATETKPTCKFATKIFCGILLTVICGGIFVLPIIG
jgi:hypothetical protein